MGGLAWQPDKAGWPARPHGASAPLRRSRPAGPRGGRQLRRWLWLQLPAAAPAPTTVVSGTPLTRMEQQQGGDQECRVSTHPWLGGTITLPWHCTGTEMAQAIVASGGLVLGSTF